MTKSPETKAFFAEASQNPSVYQRVPASGPEFSAANAPFVDAAGEDEEPVPEILFTSRTMLDFLLL